MQLFCFFLFLLKTHFALHWAFEFTLTATVLVRYRAALIWRLFYYDPFCTLRRTSVPLIMSWPYSFLFWSILLHCVLKLSNDVASDWHVQYLHHFFDVNESSMICCMSVWCACHFKLLGEKLNVFINGKYGCNMLFCNFCVQTIKNAGSWFFKTLYWLTSPPHSLFIENKSFYLEAMPGFQLVFWKIQYTSVQV